MKKSIKSVLTVAVLGATLAVGYEGGQTHQRSADNVKQEQLIKVIKSQKVRTDGIIYRNTQLANTVQRLAPSNCVLAIDELTGGTITVKALSRNLDDTLTMLDKSDTQLDSTIKTIVER